MASDGQFPVEGGCACKHVRYRLLKRPLIVHCCHCTWCQREAGSAFIMNALIESDDVVLLNTTTTTIAEDAPIKVSTPSDSGSGQDIFRCPKCYVALWSLYSSPLIRFVRVGTLDRPELCPPSVHIFTASKQPWVQIPDPTVSGVPTFEGFYTSDDVWSQESRARRDRLSGDTPYW